MPVHGGFVSVHGGLVSVHRGLVVLVGPPASGKTAFRRELVAQGRIDPEAVVSSDDIRAELFAGSPSADPEVFDERDRRIGARLAAGLVAVAESTNVTPEARARLAALARRFGAPVTVLRFAQDEDVLLRQHEERARDDMSAADVSAYAAVMRRHASRDQLLAEGAAFVHDVPGRGQGVTAAEAARRFTFGRP
ncbi:AAA family ATPase [Streptomyces sp. SID13726]|uniref:AAA family ATPase n=1 Tax=Streptomyces sp. SID13726 TaxID=2706058 RepID=UPI0019442C11|nr:AAA family ATPase [Streptomyces sp. SID13726]